VENPPSALSPIASCSAFVADTLERVKNYTLGRRRHHHHHHHHQYHYHHYLQMLSKRLFPSEFFSANMTDLSTVSVCDGHMCAKIPLKSEALLAAQEVTGQAFHSVVRVNSLHVLLEVLSVKEKKLTQT
jgi:hypothetical protein